MEEGWCAFMIALISESYLTPETSFNRLHTGIIPNKTGRRVSMISKDDIADMIKLKEECTYDELGELYGIHGSTVCKYIKNYTALHV